MPKKPQIKLVFSFLLWLALLIGICFSLENLLTQRIKNNFFRQKGLEFTQNINSRFKQNYLLATNKPDLFWPNLATSIREYLKAKDVFIIDVDSSLLASTQINPDNKLYLEDKNYHLALKKQTFSYTEKEDSIIYYLPFYFGDKVLYLRVDLDKTFYLHKLKQLAQFQDLLLIAMLAIFIISSLLFAFIFYRNHKEKKQMIEEDTALIEALAYQAEGRDLETGKHLERTKLYVYNLALYLKKHSPYKKIITNRYLENLIKASVIHDIGKVAVPENILFKRGKLSIQEFDLIKEHCLYGAKIINRAKSKFPNSQFLTLAMEIILYHHERFDGTGYPKGLKGENIPLSARIMAIVDVYDAMRSKKCYKEALEHEKCVRYILSQKGMHFDPVLVDAFYSLEKTFLKISLDYADNTNYF
ncbi:MAG: hypothetical protein PWR24_684 [Desulfonauticus sp.]|jgi:putative two-component system response regulator|nr:hypothetical protein [Desulfonauticus sp.]